MALDPLLATLMVVLEERPNDPSGLLVLPRAATLVHIVVEPTSQAHQCRVAFLRERYLTFILRCRYHVADEGVDASTHLLAEGRDRCGRKVVRGDDPGPQGVVDVVVDVSNTVSYP